MLALFNTGSEGLLFSLADPVLCCVTSDRKTITIGEHQWALAEPPDWETGVWDQPGLQGLHF